MSDETQESAYRDYITLRDALHPIEPLPMRHDPWLNHGAPWWHGAVAGILVVAGVLLAL
jgi:hypothetical protein